MAGQRSALTLASHCHSPAPVIGAQPMRWVRMYSPHKTQVNSTVTVTVLDENT
jgi:hypothetical protein